MPSYNVPLEGGGEMTVNASDQAAAIENVQVQGGTPASGGTPHVDTTRSGGGTDYPTRGPSNNGGGDSELAMLIAGQKAISDAIATGNHEALVEAIRQFDLSFGLDRDKFGEAVRQFNAGLGVTEAGLTGMYKGQQTLQAQNQAFTQALAAAGLTGTYQGQPTLQAQNQYFTQGLAGITTAAGLQANPFRQQQVLGQLGPLLGGGPVAGFQAPNTVAGVGTMGGNTKGGLGYLEQMIQDIRNPTPNQTNVNQVLDAIPTPNKLNSVDFMRASPSTQQMILQGMQEKYGLDPADAFKQVQNTLPQFQAPTTVGTIRR